MKTISEAIRNSALVLTEYVPNELQAEAWRKNGTCCFRAEFLKLELKLNSLGTMTVRMLSKENNGCMVKSMANNSVKAAPFDRWTLRVKVPHSALYLQR